MQQCWLSVRFKYFYSLFVQQIASYLARVHGKSMPRALEMFTKARPPGIYKHYYIR